MVQKFSFGTPFNTEAVVADIPVSDSLPDFLTLSSDSREITATLNKDDIIFGLGENMRGINKRGFKYISNNSDEPHHHEDKNSLYGSHNFILVDGNIKYGLFIDFPATVTFDIGYTDLDMLAITVDGDDYDLYVITGETDVDIIREFRSIIGRSYVAPKWAFGYQQSRWGYASADDIREVVKGYRNNSIPLDAVYLDIDYMERFKDFTVNNDTFPDFKGFVEEMKSQNIHLVPIIDAGVKIEEGYSVYEEGVEKGYFCKDENGEDFVAAVWPGKVYMPDFLNPEARKWFGHKYKFLTDMGIDGFWNDMNEPALFYSEKQLNKVFEKLPEYSDKDLDIWKLWEFQGLVNSLANSPKDYSSFYHNVNGEMIRHDKLHNLYGYNMTRAASEAFKELVPDKRILMFSRSSYIGMHRYGGIWTGDNSSWWAHIELLIHMLPNINMCGFLYTGADTGGFGSNATEDLVMRFVELSIFTPLFRNHSAIGTRVQELYRFKNIDSFRHLINLRYGLIPYIYSEYLKAIDNNSLMFAPLAIAYPDDSQCRHIEDQLMVGESIMIAPVYKQNATGRYVYLPEDMLMLRFRSLEDYDSAMMKKGHHYVDAALNEVLIFVRKGSALPIGCAAQSIDGVSTRDYTLYHAENTHGQYIMYVDDGVKEVIEF
ncbi:MAG: TIM-barrel domain-containing protein [Butyrivibrio sp.]